MKLNLSIVRTIFLPHFSALAINNTASWRALFYITSHERVESISCACEEFGCAGGRATMMQSVTRRKRLACSRRRRCILVDHLPRRAQLQARRSIGAAYCVSQRAGPSSSRETRPLSLGLIPAIPEEAPYYPHIYYPPA